MPKRCGKLKDLTKFDASFFGVHPKQANGMDPQLRMLLEVTYEALNDAGGCSVRCRKHCFMLIACTSHGLRSHVQNGCMLG